MKIAENGLEEQRSETMRLASCKTEVSAFNKTRKQFNLKNLQQDIKLFKCTNHCLTVDNYLDKYLPIRSQALINESLRSILSGKERRRLELYDNDKNSLLYQQLLCDDGSGNIMAQMRELHEVASKEIEEEEAKKKRRMNVAEAS